jgi:molybdopterin converting factor small subunit
MPKITVELASPLSNQAGWRKREFEASSLPQAVNLLYRAFPVEIQRIYFDPEPPLPKPFLLFLLNHEDIRRKQGFETLLHEGDLLQVAIALSGG